MLCRVIDKKVNPKVSWGALCCRDQGHKPDEDAVKRKVIGVMGPGRTATERQMAVAYQVGRVIAETGCNLLNGGGRSRSYGCICERCS